MLIPKEKMMDRIEQSFVLFKNNFFKIFLPFFLYNFVYFLIWYFSYINASVFISNQFLDSTAIPDLFSLLNNTSSVIFISIATIFFLLYLLLYIPLYISLIKSIKDWFESNSIDIKKNLYYWFTRTLKSFTTYYFIFIYVLWIPALLFITWWVLFNLTFFLELEVVFRDISIWLMIFSLILFIFFSIYRGLKSRFWLISAIDQDSYGKDNFKKSVHFTKGNWTRMLWNIFFVWLIVWLVKTILTSITSLLSVLKPSSLFDYISVEDITSIANWWNINEVVKVEDIKMFFEWIWKFELLWFIQSIINVWINTIWLIFTTVFLYILFKRIEIEKNIIFDVKKEPINKQKEEKLEIINWAEKIQL